MPKDSLKDKLDGNELDLSLNNLEVVPVKDLVGNVFTLILLGVKNTLQIRADSAYVWFSCK